MRPIGELTVNLDRKRVPVKASERRAGRYPYYGASGVVDHVDDFLFEGLHLLVAEDGENLRSRTTPVAFLADGRFWVNNHAHVLRGNSDNDTRFLAYALESVDLSGYITGSAQPKLNQAALSAIKVPAPTLAEQRAIAATVGVLDEKIESSRRAAELALGLLDAVSCQQSAVVPKVSLGSLARLVKTVAKPATYGDQIVRHYSLPAFDAGARPERVVASSVMSNKVAMEGPAVLVSRLNPRFNRTWWVDPESKEPSFASPEFAMLQTSDRRSLAGVWLAVRDENFREELTLRVTGTSGSHQRIRPDDMLAIEVPDTRLTSADVLDVALILLDRIESHRREIDALANVRDALLPELLSGRVRVPIGEAA